METYTVIHFHLKPLTTKDLILNHAQWEIDQVALNLWNQPYSQKMEILPAVR